MAAGIALVEYSRAQYVQPITGIRVINKCTKIVFVAMWYGPYGAGSQQVVPERRALSVHQMSARVPWHYTL